MFMSDLVVNGYCVNITASAVVITEIGWENELFSTLEIRFNRFFPNSICM